MERLKACRNVDSAFRLRKVSQKKMENSKFAKVFYVKVKCAKH